MHISKDWRTYAGYGFFLIFLLFILNWSYFSTYIFQKLSDPIVFNTQYTAQRVFPNTLLIPSLNIQAPIQYVDEHSEKVFQQALQKGVVHYPGTGEVGQAGNVYIFGHSSDFIWSKGDYKNVFAKLPEIKIGDEILVGDQVDGEFVYKVISKKIVDPNDLAVLEQDLSKRYLTLQTSYPLGTALKRYIVVSELQNP